MDEFLSDKEQVQQLRDWWHDNGWYLAGGVVLGVAALTGWNQYQAYHTRRAEAAAALYLQLNEAVEDGLQDDAAAYAAKLTGDYGNTPYADHAGLAMARVFMEASEPQRAAQALRGVLENTSDVELTLIARLRLARVLAYTEQYDEALELIQDVDSGRFRSRYSEVMGDIYVSQGDPSRARAAYAQALGETEPGLVDRALVQMKLDDLPAHSGTDGVDAVGEGEQPVSSEENS